jgi:hypothetical protein
MQKTFLFGALVGIVSAGFAQRAGVALPDAVTADPKHYAVSFENDVVRLLRVNYGAGEKSAMHRHPASCAVFLTDQTFNFTLPDGTAAPAAVPAGALGCSDANAHLPENIASDAEFIMIEFKNREKFR